MKEALFVYFITLFLFGCGQDSLHEAAERGELTSIEQEIAKGSDINSQNGRDGETPLQRAATRGKYDAANLLISEGAKVNLGRTKDGETALDLAEDRNHIEVANLLISNGGIRSDGTKYGWYNYVDDINSWKLKFNDGKIIYAEAWKPTGEKCPETSIDRNGNGVVVLYREDGSKWRTDRYINGKISERNYHGMSTRWDEHGHKRSQTNYLKDKLDGLQTHWEKNGRKQVEQNYKESKRDGIDNTWYSNGQIQRESRWAEDKLLSAEVWKPNGEKCPETNMQDGNGIVVWYDEDGTEEIRKSYIDGEVVLSEKSVKEFSINPDLVPKNMLIDELDALLLKVEEQTPQIKK
tara:strand:+ start:3204 stop:4253 length:1050 start_codon:yes stop_codon:yes gene_type:complete